MELKANHNITQVIELVEESEKYDKLLNLLQSESNTAAASKILVFCERKKGCDYITRKLRTDGWPALAIHGDKSQSERDWVLSVSPNSTLSMRLMRFSGV